MYYQVLNALSTMFLRHLLMFLQYTPPKDWRFRTHNLKVPSFGESLKIPVCGHCAVVCRDFEIIQSSPVCGPCVVVCEDFEFSEFP